MCEATACIASVVIVSKNSYAKGFAASFCPKKRLQQKNGRWLPDIQLDKESVVSACAGIKTQRNVASAGNICQRDLILDILGNIKAKSANAIHVVVVKGSGNARSVVAANLQKTSINGLLRKRITPRKMNEAGVAMLA